MITRFLTLWLTLFTLTTYAQLDTKKGDAFEISSVGGNTISNVFMHKQWLYRNAAGNDWFTASLHDAIAIDVSFLTPQSDTRTWWERNPYTGAQSWGNGAQTAMTILDGNLGIGTLNPSSRLEVAGAVDLKYNSVDGYWLKHTDLAGHILGGFKREANSFMIRAFDGLSFAVGNMETKALTLLANGDMGIGTSTPREKLSVNGNIRAKEVKVEQNNWPDYVFTPAYQLTSLPELERYINANKHLPGMPTAKQIETKGLELGEIVKLQQQKIEELTLYIIEMRKEMDTIKTKSLKNK